MNKVNLDAITEKIIGAAHEVSNTLGIGFIEKVYENSHAHEMRKVGLTVVQQHPIKVTYDGVVVGEFFVDLLVDDLVLVELKAASTLNDDHMMQPSITCVPLAYQLACSSISEHPERKFVDCIHHLNGKQVNQANM